MVIDLGKCLGCHTCSVVCKQHNAPAPKNWWNRVYTPGDAFHEAATAKYGEMRLSFLPVPCMHCDNAPCVKVCPVGATFMNERGAVLIDYERCIGCRYCMAACPYGVRQFNWRDPKKLHQKMDYAPGYTFGYPEDYRDRYGRLVYTPFRPKGVVEKCSFCVQYVEQNELPACVRSCPGKARYFGDLDDPESDVAKLLAKHQAFRLLEELETRPKVFYLPPVNEVGETEAGVAPKLHARY